MSGYEFETVDVFTEAPFGGNQLAVFTNAEGLSDAEIVSNISNTLLRPLPFSPIR